MEMDWMISWPGVIQLLPRLHYYNLKLVRLLVKQSLNRTRFWMYIPRIWERFYLMRITMEIWIYIFQGVDMKAGRIPLPTRISYISTMDMRISPGTRLRFLRISPVSHVSRQLILILMVTLIFLLVAGLNHGATQNLSPVSYTGMIRKMAREFLLMSLKK